MDAADARPADADRGEHQPEHRLDRTRAVLGGVVLIIVLAAAAIAVYRQRESIADTLRRIGAWPMVLSGVAGLVGIAATYPLWREVLYGLGVRIPWLAGSRVFFVSQLGKYIPGSVWPVVLQMEAGRTFGARRRTVLSANLVTVVLGCAVGLVLACLLLPLYDATALGRYWWLFLALPFLIALLHPRAMPTILDRLFALARRPPLGGRLEPRSVFGAVGWSLLSWFGLGAHLFVICAALGHASFSVFVLCSGGMALAVSAGVLFIPAPAGAGIRDVVLALVLRTLLDSGQALAVVIASRVILIFCDLFLALSATLVGALVRRSSPTPDGHSPGR